jgi:hypothetical protein
VEEAGLADCGGCKKMSFWPQTAAAMMGVRSSDSQSVIGRLRLPPRLISTRKDENLKRGQSWRPLLFLKMYRPSRAASTGGRPACWLRAGPACWLRPPPVAAS